MLKYRTRSWAIVATLGLAITLGCSTDPAGTLTLDDLVGQLDIFFTSSTDNTSSAGSSGFAPEPGTNAKGPFIRPTLSQVRIPAPGTRQVLSWKVDRMLPISSARAGSSIVHTWPFVDWPAFHVISQDDKHIGNSGIIFWKNNFWWAETTEWLRIPNERTGTTWDPHEKLTVGQPRDDHPVGLFIAGPWRHSKNEKKFQRRTEPDWHLWGNFKPFSFGDEGDSDKDDPVDPEEKDKFPTEIHVFITAVRTELAGGNVVTFPGEVGDVDLLTLFGRQHQVVDGDVPPGTYNYVVFRVDRARSFVVINGEQKPLDIPDDQIRVEGPFVVGPGGPTTVVFDLDPVSQLAEHGDGSWTMILVITVTPAAG